MESQVLTVKEETKIKDPKDFYGELKELIKSDGRNEISISEILGECMALENRLEVPDEDFEVLTTFSLILGAVDLISKRKISQGDRIKEEQDQFPFRSVEVQQEVVRMVLSNLDADGDLDRTRFKIFGLITNFFDNYFNPSEMKIKEARAYTESGLWQGVLGMVSVSLLFKKIGWEVRLPDPKWDIRWGVDLLVKGPQGKVYAVDVTAKMPENQGAPSFFVTRGRSIQRVPLRGLEENSIRINVPPLRNSASNGFYRDRVTCCPSSSAIDHFKAELERMNINVN